MNIPVGRGRTRCIVPVALFAAVRLAVGPGADAAPEWVSPSVEAPRVRQCVFESAAARTKVSYHVYTPEAYDAEPSRRFPVLYWLHGGGGSGGAAVVRHVAPTAERFDRAIRDGKIPSMLVVFPNGLDSLWVDSKDGRMPMETVVIRELIPDVDARFRTIAAREGRIVEGFSMGGYGAARLGFGHHDLFAAVSILSGGPLQREFTAAPRVGPRGRDRTLRNVFGGDEEYFRARSPWVLAERNAAALTSGSSRIRMVVGDRDEMLANVRAFEDHLKALKIPHDYAEVPGVGHNPTDMLDAMGDAFWAFHRSALSGAASAGAPRPPNIVVIVSDDQGYADIGVNPRHPPEVATPHLDALAREGVFFSQAYISGSVCSPTRAGLMLGRYQHRVGVYSAGDGGRGFDPKIPIFPAFLPSNYISTAIGKWHLGLDEDYPELKWHALNRGFDDCYLFMGRGGHDYFRLAAGEDDDVSPLYRGKQRIDDHGYLTTRLSEEAVAFIDRNKARPFFLYLAYNAVHAPAQAPKADIDRIRAAFPALSDARVILMAMLHHLDLGVGSVVAKLKAENLWDHTLLFFLTDNGGAKGMEADNSPLRGFKHSCYEGGIRAPFVASWPARFAGGRTIDTPVISLDILPTALDAIGIKPPAGPAFDGKSLLPLLTGAATRHHDVLHWDNGGLTGEWAVREGGWKLHGLRDQVELFDLAADPAETTDLAAREPDRVRRMTALHEAWLEPMPAPINGAPKRWTAASKPEAPTEREILRKERKKERDAEKKARKHPPARAAGEPAAPESRP